VNDQQANAYAKRFERVFAYIERHLDEPLSVEQLSRVAYFSKFHFHRQFSQYAGIGVTAYVRRLRLKRASYRLVFSRERVIDIALEAGFESPEAFARAFRQTFGQSPSQFRTSPRWQPWSERYQLPPRERNERMEVQIVDFNATQVALLEHCGAPELVNDAALRFIAWRKASGLSPVKTSRSFGIVYGDPDTTPADEFRFDICGEVTALVPANPQGVTNGTIPGGRCAVVRHLGSHERIGESIYPLYREWLPGSGEEVRDFPLFFHYLNLFPEVAEHELVTDIYLPLR
jgi:AraC family transcriptional regulator